MADIPSISAISDPAGLRIMLLRNNEPISAPVPFTVFTLAFLAAANSIAARTTLLADMAATDIGSTVFAQNTSAAAVAVGASTAGSNLKLAKSSATGAMTQEASALSGTWINCGSAHPAAGTTYSNYRRIA